MSGSGNQPEQLGLGGKILQEIRAAFALVRKDLGQHAIDLDIAPNLVILSAHLRTLTYGVRLRMARAKIKEGLRKHKVSAVSVHQHSLITETRLGTVSGSCRFEAISCYAPVLAGVIPITHAVTFDNLIAHQIHELPTGTIQTQLNQLEAETMPAPTPLEIPPVKFKARKNSKVIPPIRVATRKGKKALYSLPIHRAPLPVHRFSAEYKERFREALAKKSGSNPKNILLNKVYDRLTPSLYQSIGQDERGTLVCVPKTEALGRMRQLPKNRQVSYLVFGQSLDTKTHLNALVPVDLEEVSA